MAQATPPLDLCVCAERFTCQDFIVQLEGCTGGPVKVTKAGYVKIDQSSYYKVKLEVCATKKPFGPYTIELLKLSDQGLPTVLAQATGYPCHTAVLEWEGVLLECTKLAVRIFDVQTFKLNGCIVGDEVMYARILELAKDTNFDENIRKVNHVDNKPPNRPYPAPPLPPQFPAGPANDPLHPEYPQIVPWTTVNIPWKSGLTPIPATAAFPYVPNDASDADKIYYEKHQSVPYSIYFYLGLDASTIPPDSPNLTIFLKNFQDRGADNYLKKVYMAALTGYIVPFYEEKIDDMLNEVYTKITVLNEPVLSAFKTSLINFFLSLHVGVDTYPPVVLEYFQRFADIIGFGDPNRPGRDADYLFGNTHVEEVKAYFLQRQIAILQNEDKSTLTYWWAKAGLPTESLLIESVHNIVAFLQYANTFYRLVADKIWHKRVVDGLVVPGGINSSTYMFPASPVPLWNGQPVLSPAYVGPVDFFAKMQTAVTEQEQLNVAREEYRILSPNTNAFSTEYRPQLPVPNPVPNPPIQCRHYWQQIMIANQSTPPIFNPSNPAYLTNVGKYFYYDVTKYAGFNANGLLQPFPNDINPLNNYNPEDYFGVSATDNNPTYNDGTVLPRVINNDGTISATLADTIPVFPTPQHYMEFGPGYRRCAGEILNYLFNIKMTKKFANLNFYVEGGVQPSNPPPVIPLPLSEMVTLAPYTAVPNNIKVQGPSF